MSDSSGTAPRFTAPRTSTRTDLLDIIGIGALNLDLIITSATTLPAGIEPNTETAVDDSTLRAALSSLGSSLVTASSGGSALNTVFALASLGRGLKLGYVGVAGESPVPESSAFGDLARSGVDVTGIAVATNALSGVCLSVMAEGERTLLTHAGANALMPEYVEEFFEPLVEYLLRARIIHVTSFLDETSAMWIGRLLLEAKRRRPETVISFDPGHVWCATPPRGLDVLGSLSDFLLLNEREFVELTGGAGTEEERALGLLRHLAADAKVLVKHPDGITCHLLEGEAVRTERMPHHRLEPDEILNATGAGDVFAAGLLAGVRDTPSTIGLGVILGMNLARHTLQYADKDGHEDFPQLATDVLGAS